MTIVFVPYRREDEWWVPVFPGRSLTVLPVAGRSFVEHQLDWAARQGATRVLVLDYEYDKALADRLTGEGCHHWPFELAYEGAGLFRDESSVRRHHASFLGTDEVRIVSGPVFPYNGEFVCVDSLRAYYDLNFRVLKNPQETTPTGYSSEPGVFLGQNVALKTGHDVKRPICLADNVCVEYDCHLEGNVIIGANSIVDVGTTLQETVVFPDTYVGRNMEFRRKIIAGSRLIDVDSGACVDIEEGGVAGRLDTMPTFSVCTIYEYLLALVLVVLATPAFLLWLPFRPFFANAHLAYKLSADRYVPLLKVLVGKARLIRTGEGDESYVFRASDGLTLGGQAVLEDIGTAYYRYRRNIRLITGVVVKSLLNRLLSSENDRI